MKYALGLLAIMIVLYGFAYKTSSKIIRIRVKEKERITVGSGETLKGKYLIYTQGEVFENTDTWLYMKFNSSDYQYKLKVGKSYAVEVAGWRIPFMSSYRNIIDVFNERD